MAASANFRRAYNPFGATAFRIGHMIRNVRVLSLKLPQVSLQSSFTLQADSGLAMPDYQLIVRKTQQRYRIRVHSWRRNMSGRAWQIHYRGGRIDNLIEAPFPKTPISLAIFLHEVGHHVIGFDRYRLRCEEEYHVWLWAFEEMRRLGVPPDARVLRRFDLSMQYAVSKALRRGMRRVPTALERFLPAIAPAA